MAREIPPFADLAGVHVLVVDDNRDSLEVLKFVLASCGALVTAASSSRSALGYLAQMRPDVVVTDLSMPGEDGYWLLEAVRRLSSDEGGDIPVVAVSAYGHDERQRALAAGFQAFVPKPLELHVLCETIARLVGR